jgi:hypothetical protein
VTIDPRPSIGQAPDVPDPSPAPPVTGVANPRRLRPGRRP